MSEVHDSWLKDAFHIDVAKIVEAASDGATSIKDAKSAADAQAVAPHLTRGKDILEVFAELQEHHGNTEDLALESGAHGDRFDEPGRLAELDPGHDPTWEPELGRRFPADDKGQ